MIKKVVLFFVLIFSIFAFDSSFAVWNWWTNNNNWGCIDWDCTETSKEIRKEIDKRLNEQAKQAASESAKVRDSACQSSWNCFDKTNFTIETTSMFDFWWWLTSQVNWSDSKAKIQSVLSIIIQKMMIVLWIISLFIMTVWAWYMITYHWEDELLSKWKTIFKAWIIALVVALSSYYLVSLIRYIIYN